MILFTFENDQNTAIKTEAFTSAREQFTCSDVIPTCPMMLQIKFGCDRPFGLRDIHV